MTQERQVHGPIAWMTQNSVAANLLMFLLLVGGIIFMLRVNQEVFPEFDLDIIQITVAYPGASPAEVEQGILLSIEEGVRSLDDVKRVEAFAVEGAGHVSVELESGANKNKALQDVKNEIDRITSFPQDAERPIVSLLSPTREVISLVLYGDIAERDLRQLAEKVRDDLLKNPRITIVELKGARPWEIGVEVPHENLRAYNLTLEKIAREISQTAVEIPGGGVKTPAGEMLLRMAERRDYGSEFADIPIVSRPDGTQVALKDIATIIDGFRDTEQEATFEGRPAIRIAVYRTGDQTPIEISEDVRAFAEELKHSLPPTVGVATWSDSAEIFADRLGLLVRNAALGLVLVLLILGTFLEIRLAFWVTMGIPISIIGSFLFFPAFGVTINMVSMFAFIVTLGIVVDDAIVVGENVYEFRQRGLPYMQAAIEGARQVSVPITFSILTNIAAFFPIMFIPGMMGKVFYALPVIVICVFSISWIESLYVLPSHLGHSKPREKHGLTKLIALWQEGFSKILHTFIHYIYSPFLKACIRNRYLTLASGVATLAIAFGFFLGGHINFVFFPKVEGDQITASAVLPYGSPIEETRKVQNRLLEEAKTIMGKYGGDRISRGMMTFLGEAPTGGGPAGSGSNDGSSSHLTAVQVFMTPSDRRPITARQFSDEWRQAVGNIPGLESLTFQFNAGPSAGMPIEIELSHTDLVVLEEAAAELARSLENFTGVKDIDDGFEEGKPQFDLKIKPEARSLGITASDLARQVRSAFYGERAFRQQRGRDEIWVMVRLPEEERESLFNVNELMIRTSDGGEIPLRQATEVERGRAYTRIDRTNGQRVVTVSADVEENVANAEKVLADVELNILPGLLGRYPGLSYSLEGEQRERRESTANLLIGFVLALIVIFAMLAIPFKSYIQPIVVMTAIPFGMVGVIAGHLLLGYDLSIISIMGAIALSGVVVNDSLVLVHAANEKRDEGNSSLDAIIYAGKRRFRPIILTSLTTFLGLAPMIFETSVQARFLIPMAISLGFGILFSTVVALILVPAFYMIVEDVRWLLGMAYRSFLRTVRWIYE